MRYELRDQTGHVIATSDSFHELTEIWEHNKGIHPGPACIYDTETGFPVSCNLELAA